MSLQTHVIIISINIIRVINCDLNITQGTEIIKNVLLHYKNSIENHESFGNDTTVDFVKNALDFFNKTERFGEFLHYYDLGECSRNKTYLKRHILQGFLVNPYLSGKHVHWEEYKSAYNKKYQNNIEETSALLAWQDNLRLVAEHNKQYLAGKHNYALHLNVFGDWDISKYVNKILKLISTPPLHDPNEDKHKMAYRRSLVYRIPDRWDWRDKGYRPRRREQWRCGACYAFAVAHALQAQLYKTHGDRLGLSPQQIVDCSVVDGNFGCEGGSLRAALRYVAREGLERELDYPYFGITGICHHMKYRVRTRAARWAMLPTGNERALQRALASIGPLAIGINASPRSFQLYRHGVYDDPLCTPYKLNHAMLLVGYTPQYWIILNWWGPNWGEDGYIRLRRGANRCGVANMAAYVEIV